MCLHALAACMQRRAGKKENDEVKNKEVESLPLSVTLGKEKMVRERKERDECEYTREQKFTE